MELALCLASRDDELLTAVAQGDHDAFAEIYDRFAPHVFGRANHQFTDPADAQDMVLAVFLEFWRQAPLLDRARANVATWLFAMPQARLAPVTG